VFAPRVFPRSVGNDERGSFRRILTVTPAKRVKSIAPVKEKISLSPPKRKFCRRSSSHSNVRLEADRPDRVRPRDHDGASTRHCTRNARRGHTAATSSSAGQTPQRTLALAVSPPELTCAFHFSSTQALTLYIKDADGSVKAVIAAKAGGLDITVLPIAQYTGSADASQVRSRSHPVSPETAFRRV